MPFLNCCTPDMKKIVLKEIHCLSGHFRAAILYLANYLKKNKAEQYIGSGIS